MSLFVVSDSLSLSSVYAFLISIYKEPIKLSFTYSCISDQGCSQESSSMVELVLSMFKALGPIQ